jgi:hypothetical protein
MNRDKVVDFQWNILDPWTVVSVSADCEKTGGGGTLQVRRLPFTPFPFRYPFIVLNSVSVL